MPSRRLVAIHPREISSDPRGRGGRSSWAPNHPAKERADFSTVGKCAARLFGWGGIRNIEERGRRVFSAESSQDSTQKNGPER